MRLDKYLIHAGYTLKELHSFLAKQEILLNDLVVKSLHLNIDENIDIIKIGSKTIKYHEFYYFLLNKLEGYVSASKDQNNPCVTSLIKESKDVDLHILGRLDKDTTGLMLLTNNKSLLHYQANPNNLIEKEYLVEVNHILKEELIDEFKKGIQIEDYTTHPSTLIIEDDYHARIIINEGKFHEIKRMFAHFSYEVIKLHRLRIGFLTLGDLKPGEYISLNKEQILKIEKDIEESRN